MANGYLIDTNAVIEYIGQTLPQNGITFMDNLPPVISIITRIELLGWKNATPAQLQPFQAFINAAKIYPLDEDIILKTISIRKQKRIKTPDAIIAATALVHQLDLISHNTDDFKNINGLTVIDPHNI